MNIEQAFEMLTEHAETQHAYSINCKFGFWGVTAPTKEQAMTEAMHYFQQYYESGEYAKTALEQVMDFARSIRPVVIY